MELVRAAARTGFFTVAGELQLETLPLLRSNGLSRSMLKNPEQMIPARSVIRLMEDSAAASGCITFGLRMAELRGIAQREPELVSQFSDPRSGEMLTRWDMVRAAPDVLVTNVSMLNVMLMRDVEEPIFASTQRWRGVRPASIADRPGR